METQVLLSASRFPVIHLRSHIPSLQAKGVFSQKEYLWTDLVMTYGLKIAPFNNHMDTHARTHTHTHTHTHPFFQAFIQTLTQDEASFQNSCLLTSVTACVCEPGLCAFAWSCYVFHERHVYTNPGRRGRRRGEEGRKEELARKRPEKEKRNQQQLTVKCLRCIGVCLDSMCWLWSG